MNHSTADANAIFNAGFVNVSGFAPDAILVLTLSAEGYKVKRAGG